ncbi:MAG: hypothetical protein ACTSYB_00075 [Candidatus Helarchaeota archaeon]
MSVQPSIRDEIEILKTIPLGFLLAIMTIAIKIQQFELTIEDLKEYIPFSRKTIEKYLKKLVQANCIRLKIQYDTFSKSSRKQIIFSIHPKLIQPLKDLQTSLRSL